MVVAEAPHRSLLQDQPPEIADFLRLFGTICSIPTVARVGMLMEAAILHLWVRLSDDDEHGQDVIYDALRRYRASDSEGKTHVELHVVFADEDESAYPSDATVYFARE